MEFCEFKVLFEESLVKNGLPECFSAYTEQFYVFSTYLLEVNQITNLTAIRNLPDTISKHLIDSLLAAEHLPNSAKVLDLGCGPGFPSIPLAIARPDLQLIALDSTAKKIAFVKDAAKRLSLTNLTAIAGRAEDVAVSKQIGKVDAVVSRAVAKMSVLSELCLPYLKTGGVFVALKASKADEELAEAKNAIQKLGGGEAAMHYKELHLIDGSVEPRCLIEIQKERITPSGYPRAYAAILKKPL